MELLISFAEEEADGLVDLILAIELSHHEGVLTVPEVLVVHLL